MTIVFSLMISAQTHI